MAKRTTVAKAKEKKVKAKAKTKSKAKLKRAKPGEGHKPYNEGALVRIMVRLSPEEQAALQADPRYLPYKEGTLSGDAGSVRKILLESLGVEKSPRRANGETAAQEAEAVPVEG